MAEVKPSNKGWVLGIAIIILIAVGAYVFIKNRASADVAVGSAYKFEILSNRKLTIQSSPANNIGGVSYRIVEPIELKSGFGLRLRKNTGAIVSGIKLAGSNQEGIFFQDNANSLAGVYPNVPGKHKITATVSVRSTNGQVKQQTVSLYFETPASASPTPRPSATYSLEIPPAKPSATVTPSLEIPPVKPSPARTGTCTTDSAGLTICS